MSKDETAVRELLRDAVPPDLEADPYSVIDGAAAYVRRTRIARTAAAAVAAVIAAAVVATAVWVGVQRPRPVPARPAPNPVTQELCRNPQPTQPPAHPTDGLTGESSAICPTGTDSGPGWALPGIPLTIERWVAFLRGGIASAPAGPCSTGPAGPAFVVVVKRVTGQRTSYRSSDLACGGREVVARYLAALAYQQADRDAAATYGNALQCSPPKPDEPMPLTHPMGTLRAVHSSGILCAYPTFDPSGPARLVPRAYRSVSLSADAMAAINADLARATFITRAPAPCGPSRHELTLRVETPGSTGPAGEHVEFVGTCIDVLRLSGNALWWRPDASTRAVLAALMPAD